MKTLHSYDKVQQSIRDHVVFQMRKRLSRDGYGMVQHIITAKSDDLYIVYSYGTHYPMWIYDPDVGWIENSDKFSRTTTDHKQRFRPASPVKFLTTDEMKDYIRVGGMFRLVKRAMLSTEGLSL